MRGLCKFMVRCWVEALWGHTDHLALLPWAKVVPAAERSACHCGQCNIADDLRGPEKREGLEEDEACDFSGRARGRRTGWGDLLQPGFRQD